MVIAFAVAVIVILLVALDAHWYHHVNTGGPVDNPYRDEVWFSLKGFDNGAIYYPYDVSEEFGNPAEPIHSFMENISFLLEVGIGLTVLWAAMTILRLKRTALAGGLAAAALAAVAAIVFYQGFGENMTASNLPGIYGDYTSFFVDETAIHYGFVQGNVWWPLLGWWLAVIACGVQTAGLVVVALLARREPARRFPGTRPSRSP